MTSVKFECKLHGEVEADPNANGDVFCHHCFPLFGVPKIAGKTEEVRADFGRTAEDLRKGPFMIEYLDGISVDSFSECVRCGMTFRGEFVHTAEECVVYRIMTS